MKKILTCLLALLLMTSCGSGTSSNNNDTTDSKETNTKEVHKEPTFDMPITMGDFEVTFYSQYTVDKVNNQFSELDGAEVIRIPVKVKNNGSETQGINMFYLKCFGSKGTELDDVIFYFDDTLDTMGELRSGAEGTSALYLLYDGDGDYYLEYNDWDNKVEVKFPIAMANISDSVKEVEVQSNTASSGESGFNKTLQFGDFEVTISDNYSFVTLNNQFSDLNGADVVKVPVHMKNCGSETGTINMFYTKCFGSKGTELDEVDTYFDESMEFAGDLRPNAEQDVFLYMLYDGDGEYCLAYNDFSSKFEVILPIKK